jgi:pyrroline-5-carboxylate reductase
VIAILGVGRLGESLVRALLSSGWSTSDQLAVTARHPERAAEIGERYGIRAGTSNADAVAGADLVVIAVKPQDMGAVLADIAPVITHDQVVLSVAAGVTTAFIESHLG